MRPIAIFLLAVPALACVPGLVVVGGETPSEPPGSRATASGAADASGASVQLDELRVDVDVAHGGLRVRAYDREDRPVDLSGARGTAWLSPRIGEKRYRFDLLPAGSPTESPSPLVAAFDLTRFANQSVAVQIRLAGVPGGPAVLALQTQHALPPTEQQQVAVAIAAQGTCPVSREPLGSMGEPLPVQVGKRTVYVCCEGCIETLLARPGKYVKPEVIKATTADAAWVAAQRTCPIMDEPLDSMGGPYRTDVAGRVVFICCPGCARKLHAEPETYLEKLAGQGVTPPPAEP